MPIVRSGTRWRCATRASGCRPSPDLLREHQIAVVVADTAGRWPLIRQVTSDFAYARLHGDAELCTSGYSARALDEWAAAVRGWAASGPDVLVYFDNDVKVHAPFDAQALAARLGRRLTIRRRVRLALGGLNRSGPGRRVVIRRWRWGVWR